MGLRKVRSFLLVVRLLLIAGTLPGQVRAAGSLIQVLFPSGQSNGNYGPAFQAQMTAGRLAIDAAGNIYVLDGGTPYFENQTVRKITPGGTIIPVAGFGSSSLPPGLSTPALLANVATTHAMALDPQGNIYISGAYGAFFRIHTDALISLYAPAAPRPILALAADAAGDLYALEASPQYFQGGYEVLKVLPDGTSVAFAGTGVAGYSGDGGPATSAQINAGDLAVDSGGNLFIADDYNYLIRKVDAQGIINKVAQGNGPITVDSSGNLYYFLQDGTLERLAPGGSISNVATVPGAGGVAVDSAGNVFVSSFGRVYALDASGAMRLIAGCACYGDGVPVTWATAISLVGLARDASGNVYFSDLGNHTVRRIAPDGTVTLVAGTGDPGFSGDGGPARQARLSSPSGLALDNAGNLYIADRGNSRIREVTADGTIQTVAGSGLAGFYGDGGPANAARIALPDGVAVDSQGNIYITDTANHRIRKVTPDGLIQTIAGSSNYGTSGDGGPASQALLINPRALVFDLNGNLLISDSSAHMVRRITPAGLIQRVSGTGVPGHTGDGGPATSAEDWTPWGLAVDAAGNIYIGDTGSSSIRMVNPAGLIQTVTSVYDPTGLITDTGGNLWIAGVSLNILAEGGSPIPLAPAISPDGVADVTQYIGFSGWFPSSAVAVVAPGELVAITGNYMGPASSLSAPGGSGVLPAELSGVQVFFDGVAAPLLQVSATQIVAVAPFEIAGKSTVGVTVEYGGLSSNTAVLGVLPAAPEITGLYTGPANPPAAPGATVSLFVTGAGTMAPPQTDGAIGGRSSIPALQVLAWLGVQTGTNPPTPWSPLAITYAGSADWLVAGSIQVNLQLPHPLPASSYGAYQVALQIGGSLSPPVELLF